MSEMSLKILEFDEAQKAVMAVIEKDANKTNDAVNNQNVNRDNHTITSSEQNDVIVISDSEHEEDSIHAIIEAVIVNAVASLTSSQTIASIPSTDTTKCISSTINIPSKTTFGALTTLTPSITQPVVSTGISLAIPVVVLPPVPNNILQSANGLQQWLGEPNTSQAFATLATKETIGYDAHELITDDIEILEQIDVQPLIFVNKEDVKLFCGNAEETLTNSETVQKTVVTSLNSFHVSANEVTYSTIYDLTQEDDDDNVVVEDNADGNDNNDSATSNEAQSIGYIFEKDDCDNHNLSDILAFETESNTHDNLNSIDMNSTVSAFETSNQNLLTNSSLVSELTNSDYDNFQPLKKQKLIIDDVIDLDDSDKEDIDEETENQIINLIESDDNDEDVVANVDIKPQNSQNYKQKSINNLIYYKCAKCGDSCGSFKKWRVHIEGQHNYRTIDKIEICNIIDKTGNFCYQCKICMEKFKNGTAFSRLLQHHFKHCPHPEYFKCRLCEMHFSDAAITRRHLTQKHPKVCKFYIKRHNMDFRHIMLCCPKCKKTMNNKCELGIHMNEEHNYEAAIGEKIKQLTDLIYECTICASRFQKKRCRLHLISHEEYKLYNCKICHKYSSNSLSTMQSHVLTKHLHIDTTKHICAYCDELFSKRGDVDKHIVEKHGIEKLCCKVCDRQYNCSSRLLTHVMLKNHQSLK